MISPVVRHLEYLDLRHDFFRVCAFIAANSILANLLPRSSRLGRHRKVHNFYCLVIDLVAFFACNWRVNLPSLDQEFMGFRRTARHAYRNWQQSRLDRNA